MKKGKEYEDFVFKIFSEYFKGFDLKQNDKIIGNESKIFREIDISIWGEIEGQKILYIVQAKDFTTHPANIIVLGEFSSVIKDVGAHKGFLVCSRGFAKTNYQYAKTLGIELLSVEDIESHKWKAKVDIPVIYVNYLLSYAISILVSSETMNEINRTHGGVRITNEDKFNFSIDGGKTFLKIDDHIKNFMKNGQIDFSKNNQFSFTPPLRLKKYPTFEQPGSTLSINIQKKFYLKYIQPKEFRGIRDHLNNSFIPTTYKLDNIPLVFNSSFIPINEEEIPINPLGFSIFISSLPENPKG
jgi:hypothetical protein